MCFLARGCMFWHGSVWIVSRVSSCPLLAARQGHEMGQKNVLLELSVWIQDGTQGGVQDRTDRGCHRVPKEKHHRAGKRGTMTNGMKTTLSGAAPLAPEGPKPLEL